MKCIVVDDEDLARKLLENYIDQIEGLELIASCDSPIKAFNILHKTSIDLIFLDIQMPEMKGTDFFASLQSKPSVIFTTAYSEYALESYDLEAVDYLLKPIRFDRFLKAVQKVRDRHQTQNAINTADTLVIKSGYDLHKIKLDEILYIESMKEYVAYHTIDKQRILSYQSLKSLEKSLASSQLMRVHRSFIVNKNHVKALINKQIKIGEQSIPVGESYFEQVKKAIFDD